MQAGDIKPSRIEASQKAAKDYIAGQPKDVVIGMVPFAGAAFVVQNPTTDRTACLRRSTISSCSAAPLWATASWCRCRPCSRRRNLPISSFNNGGGFGAAAAASASTAAPAAVAAAPDDAGKAISAAAWVRPGNAAQEACPGRAWLLQERRHHPDDRRPDHHRAATRSRRPVSASGIWRADLTPSASARRAATMSALAVSRCAPSSTRNRSRRSPT